MLMRTDPFRELDRLAQQVLGTASRPAAMPMDAWQEDHEFVVAFDLPGVAADSVELDVERNVLTVRADRRRAAARRVQPPADPRRHPGYGQREGHLRRRRPHGTDSGRRKGQAAQDRD